MAKATLKWQLVSRPVALWQLFDILQPAYAGLHGGAIHPTAEAHAIVADHVLRHARATLDGHDPKRDLLESRAR